MNKFYSHEKKKKYNIERKKKELGWFSLFNDKVSGKNKQKTAK